VEAVPLPDELLAQKQLREFAERAVAELDPRGRDLVRAAVGFDDVEPAEVVRRMGISSSRASQIRLRAMRALRLPSRSAPLKYAFWGGETTPAEKAERAVALMEKQLAAAHERLARADAELAAWRAERDSALASERLVLAELDPVFRARGIDGDPGLDGLCIVDGPRLLLWITRDRTLKVGRLALGDIHSDTVERWLRGGVYNHELGVRVPPESPVFLHSIATKIAPDPGRPFLADLRVYLHP